MAAEPAEDPFGDHLFPHILRHMTDFDPSPETQGSELLDSILESLVLKGSKNLLDKALAIRLCSPGIENLYSEGEGVPSMENSKAKDSRDHSLGRRLALGHKRPFFHTQSDSSANSRIYDIVEPQEHFSVVDQMQSNPVSLPPGGGEEEELKKYRYTLLYKENHSRMQRFPEIEGFQESSQVSADMEQNRKLPPGEKNNKKLTSKRLPHSEGKILEDAGLTLKSGVRQSTRRKSAPSKHRLNEGYIYGQMDDSKPTTPRASLQGQWCSENESILHEENKEICGFQEASQVSPEMEPKRKAPPSVKYNKKLTSKRLHHLEGKDTCLAWKSDVRQSTRSKPSTPRASLQGHRCSESQGILHEENQEIRGFQEASQVSPDMEQKRKSPPGEKNKKLTLKRQPHSGGKNLEDAGLAWKSGVRQSTRRKSTPSKHRLNEGYIYGQIDDSKPTTPRASLQGHGCSENQSILHENKKIRGFQEASQVSPEMEQKRKSPPSEKDNIELASKRLPHSERKDTCVTWKSGVRQSTRRKSTPSKHCLNEGYIYGQIDDSKSTTPRASLQGHGCSENQSILHEENTEILGFQDASQVSPDMEQKRKTPPSEKNNKELTLKRLPHSEGKGLEGIISYTCLTWKSGVRQSTRRKSTPSKHRLNEGYIYGQIDDSLTYTPDCLS